MAYNYPPAPQFYPPMQQTGYSYTQQTNNQQNNRIICEYVQGEEAAKSYPVAPGQFAVIYVPYADDGRKICLGSGEIKGKE